MNVHQRIEPIRSKKVLNHARGQSCTARFPGICNGNAETVVFCHLNGAAFGKGGAMKAHDVLGFFGCADCHRYYDVGHGTKAWIDNDTLLECLLSAVCETWVRLIKDGVVFVPLDAPKPFSGKPVKARKPKTERKPIPVRADPWPEGTRKLSKAVGGR